jgi:antitoxin VapB
MRSGSTIAMVCEFRSEVTEASGRYRRSNWRRRIDDGRSADDGRKFLEHDPEKSVAVSSRFGRLQSYHRPPPGPAFGESHDRLRRDLPAPALAVDLHVPYVCGICHMKVEKMSEQRHVKLFRNGRNQAVRIPVEFELPGNEAIMHRDGDRLVIEPVRKRGLIALLKTMQPVEEAFPQIDDPVPAPEKVL